MTMAGFSLNSVRTAAKAFMFEQAIGKFTVVISLSAITGFASPEIANSNIVANFFIYSSGSSSGVGMGLPVELIATAPTAAPATAAGAAPNWLGPAVAGLL